MVKEDEKKEYTKEEIRRTFNILSANELISLDIPEQKWIVKDLIPESSFLVFSGQKGVTKSLLNKYFGLCIATGSPVFDEFEVVKKGPVLFFDEEGGNRRMRFRVTKISNGLDVDKSNEIEFYSVIKQGFKIDEPQRQKSFTKWMEEIIKHYKPVFIVCDSLVRMMTGDENSSKDVRRIFDNLSPLMEKYGVTFSMIHHSCKDGRGFRGSGDFEYMADKTFVVKKNNKSRTEFTLEQDKERDNDFIEKIGYSVVDSEDGSKILFNLTGFQSSKKKDSVYVRLAIKIEKFMEIGKKYKKAEITEFLKRPPTDASVQKALQDLESRNVIQSEEYGYYIKVSY